MEKRDVVIVGGGPAGRVIVHMLYASNRDFSVTLIKNEEINVNRCAVPYGIPDEKPIKKFQISNKLVTDFGAELVVDQVEKIDSDKKEVFTKGGRHFSYGDLVLATGSRPVVPPIPGVNSKSITCVRSLADLSVLRDFSKRGKRAVVVGGGYIGIEVAVILSEMGIDVSLVEMLPKILMATLEPEFISHVENVLNKNSIHLLTNEKVVEFEHLENTSVNVKLGSGIVLPSDFVVLSVGVVPNMELAAQSGIKTSRFGICVDEYMRTSAEHVYSCGDCAEKRSFITHQPTRGEFGTNSVFMAKVTAQNIIGGAKKFPGVINANATSVFDLSLGSAGLTEQMAIDAGLNVFSGRSKVMDKYPMMDNASVIHTKLVFNQKDQKLIGGSILGNGHGGTAPHVDFISLAIQMGATIDDLLTYQYCTHPELAAKPSDNCYVFAARDAFTAERDSYY